MIKYRFHRHHRILSRISRISSQKLVLNCPEFPVIRRTLLVGGGWRGLNCGIPSMSGSEKGEVVVSRSKRPNTIIVNSNQRGNPVLKYIFNAPWEYGETLADYELARTSCALFLSLRYHKLHPNYIYERFQKLGNNYNLRILLVLVDVKDHGKSLRELMRVSVSLDFSLILSWSSEEAGRYLETFKIYENKPVDMIKEKTGTSPFEIFQDAITVIKSVNKTDALTLAKNFKKFREIATLKADDLALCPGFGNKKIENILKVFNEPFMKENPNPNPTPTPNSKSKPKE